MSAPAAAAVQEGGGGGDDGGAELARVVHVHHPAAAASPSASAGGAQWHEPDARGRLVPNEYRSWRGACRSGSRMLMVLLTALHFVVLVLFTNSVIVEYRVELSACHARAVSSTKADSEDVVATRRAACVGADARCMYPGDKVGAHTCTVAASTAGYTCISLAVSALIVCALCLLMKLLFGPVNAACCHKRHEGHDVCCRIPDDLDAQQEAQLREKASHRLFYDISAVAPSCFLCCHSPRQWTLVPLRIGPRMWAVNVVFTVCLPVAAAAVALHRGYGDATYALLTLVASLVLPLCPCVDPASF